MSNIEKCKIDWIWNQVIPLDRLTLFAGDGGLGKSLTAIDIAARGSVGRPMPFETEADRRPPFSTIIIQTEDDLESTIKPRLEAAGADASKVHMMNTILLGDGTETSFDAVKHLDQLADAIDSLGDCSLVLIDSLPEFMPGVNFWKDHELRAALSPLRKLAKDKHVSVVVVSHLNKGQQNSAKQRVTGSTALVNSCRANWLFTPHPDDEEVTLMLSLKGNDLERGQTGFSFSLEEIEVFGANAVGTPRILWMDERSTITADQAQQRQRMIPDKSGEPAKVRKIDETVNWLTLLLSGGPKSPKQIDVLGKEHGYKEPTVYRAKKMLGVVKNEFGEWQLPPDSKAA
jgi:hypothetical protein